jgi:phosphoenolpyruvate carboxykinase (ATP)
MTTATMSTPRAAHEFGTAAVHANLAAARLVELAIERGEGILAANGALNCLTGARTGRSPDDKYLEDTPAIHDRIAWGKVNQPVTPAHFEKLYARVMEYMRGKKDLFRFDGYAGGDPAYRLKVSVFTEEAWHSLFAKTLFINAASSELAGFKSDWTVIDASRLELEDPAAYGVKNKLCIMQSLERKVVLIVGTRYAGEIKKSIFYAMNFDLPEREVFPMHCSANVAKNDDSNVAVFFGLSGTGKTTLSADPQRRLIGDDEHGWSANGVFNIEGGCYAKCINLSKEGEPQIWNAIRFGSVLENVVVDKATRVPNYDTSELTENTRVTYPLDFVPDCVQPPIGKHPKNVIFLSADAFGVLPPVAKLTPEQAQYYFVNGYTSKLAGTEAGVKEPTPNFSACFGGPFMPRPPMVYAGMLAKKISEHKSSVWLVNTGWTGGPYGVGSRFKLSYTRAILAAILDGSLANAKFVEHPVFGLHMPVAVPGVPAEMLDPRNTWADKAAYDAKAKDLAKRFRDNDAKYALSDAVRNAGPRA